MLTLPAAVLAAVLQHTATARPAEACGLIAGPARQPDGAVVADRHIPMTNNAPDPATGFVFDPAEQLAAYADMDARSEDPVVLYHSHPRGPATPSPRDVAGAASAILWLIVDRAGHVRCWRIADGMATEVDIQVVERDDSRPPR